MKRSTIKMMLASAFMLIGMTAVFAQPAGFKAMGTNSTDVVTTDEDIDSVTVGSQMQYVVMPDLSINQDGDGAYDYTTNADALISTFTWSATTGETFTEAAENDVTVTWATSGVRTITVTETAAGCPGTPVTFDVEAIAVPTITLPAAGGSESFCTTGADGTLTEDASPINVTYSTAVLGAAQLEVSYSIACTNGAYTGGTNTVSLDEGAGTFDIAETLTHYGTYTVTITNITDRISRKPVVDIAGSLGANLQFSLVVSPTPSTGNVYRLPNM